VIKEASPVAIIPIIKKSSVEKIVLQPQLRRCCNAIIITLKQTIAKISMFL